MEFLIATILFPALLVALALGAGLLIDKLAGGAVPGVLLAPIGLAALVVVAELFAYRETIAPATPVALAVLGFAGLILGSGRLRRARPDWWLVAAAVGVYLMTVAPVLLAGRVTLAGYLLDTTVAFHLSGADYLIEHARNFESLEPSAYRVMMENYFGTAYPSGGHTLLGGSGRLVGTELIWLYQPFMSLLLALCTPTLYYLARAATLGRWIAAGGAFLASAPALVYAYAQMGAIKELSALPFVLLLGALLVLLPRLIELGARAALVPAVVAAAGIGAIGLAFIPWLAVTVVAGLVLTAVARRGGRWRARPVAVWVGALVVGIVLLALPTVGPLTESITLAKSFSTSNQVAVADPGNLLRPLLATQMAGVWLGGSHRVDPPDRVDETFFLIGLAVVAMALGLLFVLRRRLLAVGAFAVALGVVWVALTQRGATWTDAKLLVLTSPIVVLLGAIGIESLRRDGRRVEAVLIATAVGLGIVVSNAFTYHDTNLAPTDRYDELVAIGERFAGDGPTLTPEFDEFAMYALSEMAPDGPGNAQRTQRLALLRDGSGPGYGASYDLDELPTAAVQEYSTIVMRRRPDTSRPPANFEPAFRGRYYEVWRRGEDTVLAHEPAGGGLQPAGSVSCARARTLARRARLEGAQLEYVTRPRLTAIDPSRVRERSPGWVALPGDGIGLYGQGELEKSVDLPAGGAYRVWLKGDFARPIRVSIDGRSVGEVSYETGNEGNYGSPLDVTLDPGRHQVRIERGGGSPRPGDAAPGRLLAVVFVPEFAGQPAVSSIEPRRWRSLCRRPLDWIAVVRR